MGAKEGSGRAGEGGDIGTGPVKSQKNSEMRRTKTKRPEWDKRGAKKRSQTATNHRSGGLTRDEKREVRKENGKGDVEEQKK
jgi:hypothetical protein